LLKGTLPNLISLLSNARLLTRNIVRPLFFAYLCRLLKKTSTVVENVKAETTADTPASPSPRAFLTGSLPKRKFPNNLIISQDLKVGIGAIKDENTLAEFAQQFAVHPNYAVSAVHGTSGRVSAVWG
jgi:hypothetical protein